MDECIDGMDTLVRALSDGVRAGIAEFGIRNSHLTAIAPTGTISLLANNVSSGVEPVFKFRYTRRVLEADGDYAEHELSDSERLFIAHFRSFVISWICCDAAQWPQKSRQSRRRRLPQTRRGVASAM